jgi:hypothetical protein
MACFLMFKHCPSAKLKSIDYYPVINTHITDNNAAHECPRYSEDAAKKCRTDTSTS